MRNRRIARSSVSSIPRGIEPDLAELDIPRGSTLSARDFQRLSGSIIDSVERVIDGKREPVELALTVLLAEGHLLIEDVPGVGKTMLARAHRLSDTGHVFDEKVS